jgi:hypothetical protein
MQFSNELLAQVLADLYHVLPTTFALGFEKNIVDPMVEVYNMWGDELEGAEEYPFPTIRATYKGETQCQMIPLRIATVFPDGYGTWGKKGYGNVAPSLGVRIKFNPAPNGCATDILMPFVAQLSDLLLGSGWVFASGPTRHFDAQYTKQYPIIVKSPDEKRITPTRREIDPWG